ncbi:MAG: tetratricopeptide repeat protein [Planctomycetaceae bacterium]|nr:tetratricopeptide repeat protein [Planctomycetaceae bacterium]
MGEQILESEKHDRWVTAGVCAFLLLAVGLVFGQTVQYGFINLDDDLCVYENPYVKNGFSIEGIRWAFTNHDAGIWAPACWLSHMLDCQMYGLDAWGHHLTNVVLHAATAILLFLVLRRMTARLWPSALAATLFAVHPLRVESVAWVTERRDVLSGLFFMLTLWAYFNYVRGDTIDGAGDRGSGGTRRAVCRYVTVAVFFALGLMAKPMLVTVPCVLLLLDYWPLGRIGQKPSLRVLTRLIAEKVPLFALAGACCMVTVWAEYVSLHKTHAARWQVENLLVSYAGYLRQTFWPVGLAPMASRRGVPLPLWEVGAAALLLAAVTAGALAVRRRHAYLIVGWLWFLGMLFPVTGLVPFGTQGAADRFTYLPQIGLCIALAWGAADLCRAGPRRRRLFAAAAALLLASSMACAWRQTTYWRDSFTLWSHAVRCAADNHLTHNLLGNARAECAHAGSAIDLNELDRAMGEYRAAIRIKPGYAEAHFNLGVALADSGDYRGAIDEYRVAIRIEPDYAYALNNLGHALAVEGQLDEAMRCCQRAIEILPRFAEAHFSIGEIWLLRGHRDEAIQAYRQAVKHNPDYLEAQCRLGETLAASGRAAEALAQYKKARTLAIRQHQAALAEELGARVARQAASLP